MGQGVGRKPGDRHPAGDSDGIERGRHGGRHHLSAGRRQDPDPNAAQPAARAGPSEHDERRATTPRQADPEGLSETQRAAWLDAEANEIDLDVVAEHVSGETGVGQSRYVVDPHGTKAHLPDRRHSRLVSRRGTSVGVDERAEWDHVGALPAVVTAAGPASGY